MNTISKNLGYLLMLLQMIVNTASTIIFKYQSQIEVDEKKFNHPFMQTFTMFLGEALCFIIFLIIKHINRAKYELELEQARKNNQETKINIFAVFVPTICDLVGSCLAFFALQLMAISVYQMLRGATIVITAIFQVLFLKRIPSKLQIIGMTLVILGNVIVGVTVYIKSNDSGNMILGIILLTISFVIFSFQVILEEKYFSKYYLNPFELVGLEGIWGLLLTTLLLFGLQYTPCPKQFEEDCPVNSKGEAYFEQIDVYFKTIFNFKDQSYQPQLILLVLGGCVSILLLNSICMAVVKYLSALTRNVIQVTTITLVWFSSILMGWEDFYWGELVGFIVLVVGSLIYNKIIVFRRQQKSQILIEDKDKDQSLQKMIE